MFTRSRLGSTQGQMQDLERPSLPPPVWVEELRQEIRAMGDLMRLREALAVANRDIERFRLERDRLLKTLKAEQDKVTDLEQVIVNHMRLRDGKV